MEYPRPKESNINPNEVYSLGNEGTMVAQSRQKHNSFRFYVHIIGLPKTFGL